MGRTLIHRKKRLALVGGLVVAFALIISTALVISQGRTANRAGGPVSIDAPPSLVAMDDLQALALSSEDSAQFREELAALPDCDPEDMRPQMCAGDEVRFAGLFLTQHGLKPVSRTHVTIVVGVDRDDVTDQVIVFYYEEEGGTTPPTAPPPAEEDGTVVA